jgi:hypothetical protein
MICFLEQDTSAGTPFPEISTGGYVRPRGMVAVGGPPIAAHLPKNLTFVVQDGNVGVEGVTDFMKGGGFVLVSEKLRQVWDRFAAEVEYVPVDVLYRENLRRGFFVANPLRRVRGIDLDASSIELDESGLALSVEKLVLDESRFEGIPLAVVHETLNLAVQPDLAAAIREAGCTGCVPIPPSTIRI